MYSEILYFNVFMYSVKESLPVSGLCVALYTDFTLAYSRSVLYTHILYIRRYCSAKMIQGYINMVNFWTDVLPEVLNSEIF